MATFAPTLHATLHAHQRVALNWLAGRQRAVLADDVGLGKTITSLAHAACLTDVGELSVPGQRCRVLIVTDASLISQWVGEVANRLPGWTAVTTAETVGRGRRAKEVSQRLARGVDVVIGSYDAVRARADWAEALRPGLVILDEASALKGMGQNWKVIRELAKGIPHALALTATPVENDLTELYAVLAAVHVPDLYSAADFDHRFITWDEAYVTPTGIRVPRRPSGYVAQAMPELRTLLSDCVLRRYVEDAGLPLTEVQRRPVFVPLTREQQRAYDAGRGRGGLLGHHARERAGLLSEDVSALAAEATRYLLSRRDKAIVYSESLDHLGVLEAHFRHAGITCQRIDGAVSGADRNAAVGAFCSGREPRVLLGSRVLERGLNLQTCRLLLSLGSSWNPAREDQREGRIRRIGSAHASVEHITFLPDTPHERKKLTRLRSRRELAEAVFPRPAVSAPAPAWTA